MEAMKKITLTVLVPEGRTAEVRDALLQAAHAFRPGLQVFLHIGQVSGPIEPDEWLDGGPSVKVVGLWDVWEPVKWEGDFLAHRLAIELEIGQHRVRLVGTVVNEGSLFPERVWELPTGVGEILGCDEELAGELLEQLAEQIYWEFAPMPTEPPPLEARWNRPEGRSTRSTCFTSWTGTAGP